MDVATSESTGSVTTGPASFSDASLTWSGDSSSPTPTPDATPAVSTSADATVPPAAAPEDGSTPASGEPPKERWPDILANARQKAAEEALAPYAWAKQVPQQEFQQLQQIAKHFSSGDLETGLKSFLAELGKDPQAAATLRALHARELAALRGRTPVVPEQATPNLNPTQIQLEDGSVFKGFSADQVQALVAQELAKVKQEFQPVFQTHETLKAQHEAAARAQAVTEFTTTTLQDVQTWPHMESPAHRKALATELAKLPDTDDPREVAMHLNAAYRTVMRTVVLPSLTQKSQSALLDTLKTKAASATSVNPGSAAASAPRQVVSFSDPSLKWK